MGAKALIIQKVGQKMKLMSKANFYSALKKTWAPKKLAAKKKLSRLTMDQTCATCEEMFRDFKTLNTSPEGLQYWKDILDPVRIYNV